jgi:hypothetical protein
VSGHQFSPRRIAAAFVAVAFAAGAAVAELGSPDASYRDALSDLRAAVRDTSGHGTDVGRLGALGDVLMKLSRFADAEKAFRRVRDLAPDDRQALAALGHIALCRQQLEQAESLLVRAGDAEEVTRDLYVLRLRQHDWRAAAGMAEAQGEEGRREMLERLAEIEPAEPTGAEHAELPFQRLWPVPLVRVKLNGTLVVMAVDPGAPEMLLEPANVRVQRVTIVPGQRSLPWNGARIAAGNAIVQKLELGGILLTNVPAVVTPLHRYSMQVNPQGANIAGVLGLPVLERLGMTLDFDRQQLELRRVASGAKLEGTRVPFERWGENELMVYGSINGGRRMAMWLGTGLPDAGLGAPQETFDEVGVRPGTFANLARSIGTALQGRPWSQVVVPTVTVGPIVRDKVPGWSGSMDAGELWRHGTRRDALLGPRFFTHARVTFDWAKRQLVFEGE